MKNLKIYFAAIALISSTLCMGKGEKFDVTVSPDQVVSKSKDGTITCRATDALKFDFTGEPNMLTFYSGQSGAQYANRNKTKAEGDVTLGFTTKANYAKNFKGILKVYVSTKFPGMTGDAAKDKANILNMDNWVDITSQCAMPAKLGEQVVTESIKLNDYKGKPFYLAFRLKYDKVERSSKYVIDNLSIKRAEPSGTTELGTLKTLKFSAYDCLVNGDPYVCKGGDTKDADDEGNIERQNLRWNLQYQPSLGMINISAMGSPGVKVSNDDWAISECIDLSSVKPDKGLPIKGRNGMYPTSYQYKYTTPGTYTVTFVSADDKGKEIVKELKINIVNE